MTVVLLAESVAAVVSMLSVGDLSSNKGIVERCVVFVNVCLWMYLNFMRELSPLPLQLVIALRERTRRCSARLEAYFVVPVRAIVTPSLTLQLLNTPSLIDHESM